MANLPLRRPAATAACLLFSSLTIAGCGSAADRRQEMVDASRPVLTAPVAEPPAAAPPQAPTKQPPAKSAPAPAEPKVVPPPPSAARGVPREWTPAAPARRWEWVIIHHSATPEGGAARFHKEHVAKGWDELGYHFVIGNGTDTAHGATEVGSRWAKQKQGAHCKTPDNGFNEKGIGICLVGNFDTGRPSDAQMRALARLVAHLQRTYRIPADRVIGHGDAKPTECPGRNLHLAQVRRLSAQAFADAGEPMPARTASAAVEPGREMLFDAR